MLLRRDPWLMSQSLMQILYLLPPALLLWKSFQGGTNAIIVLVPMMVMAAGHLGGNLAWLSISGEDAPDLITTAPISARRIIWAKIEAVMGAIAMMFAPFLAVLAFALGLGGIGGDRRADRGGLCHVGATLLPHPGAAQPIPPPPDLVTYRHVRGSLFVDRLGGCCGARRGRHLVRAGPGDICRRYFGRREMDQPAQSRIGRAITLPRHQQPHYHQIENVRADAGSEGWCVKAEMIVQQTGEPAA